MTPTNPYQAPASNVTQADAQGEYQPKIWAVNGRIGRLRYLAYTFASYLPVVFVGAIFGATAATTGEEPSSGIFLGLLGIAYIFMIIAMFIIAKRRLNDLDKTGWMSLLFLIPIVNFVVGIWLTFGRGTDGSNRFGLAPSQNSLGVKIGAFALPTLFIIGVLAPVAIFAYSDYQERAASRLLSE